MQNYNYIFYTSGSQPFLACGTLNIEKKLAAHLHLEIFEKVLENKLISQKASLQEYVKFDTRQTWQHV